MIFYVSDFDPKGSGYRNIGVPLMEGLVAKGYETIALGLGYRGQPHSYNFSLCPAHLSQLPTMLKVLPTAKEIAIQAWIVALDIPLQLKLMAQSGYNGEIPWIGIFPVEGDPLCQTWTARLWAMSERLIISEFGRAEAEKVGLEATHLQIGVDTEFWKPPELELRKQLRESLEMDDKFVVLTVADNQERKNLSAAAEIVGKARQQGLDVVWALVTRADSPVGWELQDLAQTHGIIDRYLEWARGIPVEELRDLFSVADLFLLTSKAEGLGMPVLEAMAMGVPVMTTECCALVDHLKDGRGFLIPAEYRHCDPWGNSHRYYIDREIAAATMVEIPKWRDEGALEPMVQAARSYVENRTWDKAVNTLVEAIENVKT